MRVFYLAVAPKLFGSICQRLDEIGVVDEHARVVLEKPIGHDLASARAINEAVGRVFSESQTFRIDHYLGKESVQNLLVTRFANTFLEPLWNSRWVDHVEITVSETVGVGGRGEYYDHAGALRDMVQNHLLQLLCLVAMEPPTYVGRETVRDEKVKVLQALRPMTPADVDQDTVRGRYDAGLVDGVAVPSYSDDLGSRRVLAPRPSWRSRPRCRTGAGPGCRSTCAPASGWTGGRRRSWWSSRSRRTRCSPAPRASPRRTGCTSWSSPTRACACTSPPRSPAPVATGCGRSPWTSATPRRSTRGCPDAYERLLMDVIKGNPTLFMRRDEVEAAWTWTEPILRRWATTPERPKRYPAGTTGPIAAAMLIERDGRTWQEPDQ